MADTSTTTPTTIPAPGTAAYWAAQREAVALINAYDCCDPSPDLMLDALRQIATHGFAARMMTAHGKPVARWIRELERITAEMDAACDGDWDGDDHAPVEYCCRCRGFTRLDRNYVCTLCGEGAEDADSAPVSVSGTMASQAGNTAPRPAAVPASCFWDCGPVSQGTQCRLCRDLERHAQGASVQAGDRGQSVPPHVGGGQP